MGDDATRPVSDARFELSDEGRWVVSISDLDECVATCHEVVALLADPVVERHITATFRGPSAARHDELLAIAQRAASFASGALGETTLDGKAFESLVTALRTLHTFTWLALPALATDGSEREHELMGLLERISHLFERASRSLYSTVVPIGDDMFRLRWSAGDRAMIRALSEDLDRLLEGDDPSIVRLFPPAYGDDAERSRGYDALARSELIESRRAALTVLDDALGRDEIDGTRLATLMRAVNDLRLVIGTRLDVSEDGTPREAPNESDSVAQQAYERLSLLLSDIVGALGG